MASYTEYFYEYLDNGNELPAIFDAVPSFDGIAFKDMFKTEYNAYEIAHETETLFKERLQAKANVVIPYYVEKITKIAGIENVFENTRVNEIIRNNQNASYLNTPNIETISNDNLAGVLKDNMTETHTENYTPSNKIDLINSFLEIKNLYKQLLNEFKTLFLFIW